MSDKVADLTARRAGRRGDRRGGRNCPICGAPAVAAFRPFCSRRCADIDLGRWLKEGYRVPTEESPGDDEAGPERGED
ncbi:MAG: DNA gyrase inhibitor YacG [Alphaproteobacteria bacterium]